MKIIFYCIFLIFCFFPKYSLSENSPPGLSNIGFAAFNITANDFNCSGFLDAIEDLPSIHISFLYNTFGNNFSCLKKILKNPKLETLEIHLINEPGHRNKRLGPYEFLRSINTPAEYDRLVRTKNSRLRKKLIDYVKPLQKVLDENLLPHTALIINPGLESNLSDRSGKILISWTRDLFPDARVVWNPLSPEPRRRAKTTADIIEGHNLSPDINEPCIYNLDGTDVSYPNRPALDQVNHVEGQSKNWVESGNPLFQLIETFANECEVAYIWTAESNGQNRNIKNFVDPRKRNHNISSSMYKTIIQDIKELNRRGEIYPTTVEYTKEDDFVVKSCDFVKTNFVDGAKKGRLLKQSEFRSRAGVLILTKEFSSVREVRLMKGRRIVDKFINVGKYKDGRTLFRSNLSPTKYPFNTYLTFDKSNKKYCYKIPNPRIRLD